MNALSKRIKRTGQPASAQRLTISCAVLGLILASASAKAQTKPHAPSAPAPAKESQADCPLPQSVFVMPSSPQEGKDPFFPRSTRPYASAIKTNQQATPAVVDLHLKGFSGAPEHPLAIINNRTFESGEEGDVITTAGRARIRCVEIQSDAVIIQFNGQRRVLHLRQGI